MKKCKHTWSRPVIKDSDNWKGDYYVIVSCHKCGEIKKKGFSEEDEFEESEVKSEKECSHNYVRTGFLSPDKRCTKCGDMDSNNCYW